MGVFVKGTCLKSDLYDTIKNAMIAAGWQNVSSNAGTDYDVLTSTGETGDKQLVFQMRPLPVAGGTASVITGNNHAASIRLVGGYTPGTGGVAGTFDRTTAAEPWRALYFAAAATSVTIDKGTTVSYVMFVNKNRVVVNISYPPAINVPPCTIWIGMPDDTYCSEPRSRGLLLACSANSSGALSTIQATDNAGELASSASSVPRNFYTRLAPKNPNSAGKYTISEIFYGDDGEGVRGKLTDVFALPSQNILHGDTITVGTRDYFVIVNGTSGTDDFPAKALAVPIT